MEKDQNKNSYKIIELIEMSDDESSSDNEHTINYNDEYNNTDTGMNTLLEAVDNTIHQNSNINVTVKDKRTDDNINNFINMCLKERLFDDEYYDYNDVFSIISTKLPTTFDSMSDDKKTIPKDKFISTFEEKYKYNGDLLYIYHLMDSDFKGYIVWDDFKKFFLPYVKNIIA